MNTTETVVLVVAFVLIVVLFTIFYNLINVKLAPRERIQQPILQEPNCRFLNLPENGETVTVPYDIVYRARMKCDESCKIFSVENTKLNGESKRDYESEFGVPLTTTDGKAGTEMLVLADRPLNAYDEGFNELTTRVVCEDGRRKTVSANFNVVHEEVPSLFVNGKIESEDDNVLLAPVPPENEIEPNIPTDCKYFAIGIIPFPDIIPNGAYIGDFPYLTENGKAKFWTDELVPGAEQILSIGIDVQGEYDFSPLDIVTGQIGYEGDLQTPIMNCVDDGQCSISPGWNSNGFAFLVYFS